MNISVGPAKSERHTDERGLPFSLAERLDWSNALIADDRHKDYGEKTMASADTGCLDLLAAEFTQYSSRPALTGCLASAGERQINER